MGAPTAIPLMLLCREGAKANEHSGADGMRSVNWREDAWHSVRRDLRSQRGLEIGNQIEIAVVSEGVSLHVPDGHLHEPGRQRVFSHQQFVGAIRIFDARPRMIARSELHKRFE